MKYGKVIACFIAVSAVMTIVGVADEKEMLPGMMKHDANMPTKMDMDANACPKDLKMGKCCQMTPSEMVKCAGMSPAMVDRCTMVTHTEIMPTDPAAMIAMKDKIMLTPEQMGKLDAIVKKAREEAAMVLTAEQSDMVKGMATSPATMMDMRAMMMQKMKEKGMMAPADKTEGKAGAMGTEQTMCPITGKPINKMYSTVYKGKTVYFCCPMCKPIFDKSAEKYLDKLPQFAQ